MGCLGAGRRPGVDAPQIRSDSVAALVVEKETVMGLAKRRCDKSELQSDGAIVWRTHWIGGKPIAKIEKCRLDNLIGDMRATVYAQGESDTFFSVPAKCYLGGVVISGCITLNWDLQYVFRHGYY
jgi:hypothetical protein